MQVEVRPAERGAFEQQQAPGEVRPRNAAGIALGSWRNPEQLLLAATAAKRCASRVLITHPLPSVLQQQRAPGMAADKRNLTWSQISKSLCAGGVAGAV
jgi:hypothetical protein